MPFFNAQFNYCQLIWMLQSRQNSNKIKHLHERCLRFINNDKLSSYEELLEKNGSFSNHLKNIQSFAIEMLQTKLGQSPGIVSNTFAQTTQHRNFRQNRDFWIRSVKSVYHGSESISYLGPKICEISPAKIKETNFPNSFKIEIRKRVPHSCPCRLCKQYISGVGFFQQYKYNNVFFCIYILFLGLDL